MMIGLFNEIMHSFETANEDLDYKKASCTKFENSKACIVDDLDIHQLVIVLICLR